MAVGKLSGDTIDMIIADPNYVEMCIKVMEMEQDVNEDYLVPFTEDDKDEDGNPIVRERNGDYGKTIKYVPIKYVRERADLAFNRKYNFLIVAERRETDPFGRKRYNRDDEEYEDVEGDKYIRCIGMMIVPGLGVRMAYGVKKVRGGAESTDWKAAQSDAFKKCCEAFGIYLDYSMADEDDDEDDSGSRRRGSGGKSRKSDIAALDLSDVEYDDDSLDEASEYEVGFGKYKGWTLSEILDEGENGESYLAYLWNYDGKGGDDDAREYAGMLLKSLQDERGDIPSRKNAAKKASGKGGTSRRDSGSTMPSSGNTRASGKGGDKAMSAADKRKRERLISVCEEALEDYDTVARRSVILSVSPSSSHPKGKTKLENLTLSELEELAEVLADDE